MLNLVFIDRATVQGQPEELDYTELTRLGEVEWYDQSSEEEIIERAKGIQRRTLHALEGLEDPPFKVLGFGGRLGRK